MNINTSPYVRIISLTTEEREALTQTYEILREFQRKLGDETMIQSEETGEVILPHELSRAMGIVSFLSDNRVISVH